MNPITNELLYLVHEGNSVVCIDPEKNCAPNKVVRFHLADGAVREFKTECDHNTFLTWWTETARVVNRIKALQNLDEQL